MNPDKLLSLVDRKMVVDLATEMVNTASPTGEEGNMARLLQRMLKEVVAIGADIEWLPGIAADMTLAIADISMSGA